MTQINEKVQAIMEQVQKDSSNVVDPQVIQLVNQLKEAVALSQLKAQMHMEESEEIEEMLEHEHSKGIAMNMHTLAVIMDMYNDEIISEEQAYMLITDIVEGWGSCELILSCRARPPPITEYHHLLPGAAISTLF